MPGLPVSRIGKQQFAISVLITTLLMLAGCASAPPAPHAALTEARDAITSAEQADARQYASADLDDAKRKLSLAESAVSSEKMTAAKQLAQQSRIAAELAIARTEAAKAAEINQQMRRDADALSEELKRMGEQQ